MSNGFSLAIRESGQGSGSSTSARRFGDPVLSPGRWWLASDAPTLLSAPRRTATAEHPQRFWEALASPTGAQWSVEAPRLPSPGLSSWRDATVPTQPAHAEPQVRGFALPQHPLFAGLFDGHAGPPTTRLGPAPTGKPALVGNHHSCRPKHSANGRYRDRPTNPGHAQLHRVGC